ncbi:hypothetical protein FQN49_005612 [Arthroderma sp. PD_2]|nr:hypothetical protein FQN49_005612 [Arthroderma sp. PD_2]
MHISVFLFYLFAFARLVTAADPICQVFPKPNKWKNDEANTKINNKLRPLSNPRSKYPLFRCQSKHLGTLFWILNTSEANCKKIKKEFEKDVDIEISTSLPRVKRQPVEKKDASNTRRSHVRRAAQPLQPEDIDWQKDRYRDLLHISRPDDKRIQREPEYYYFDKKQGEGTVIYMIDSGAELSHHEYVDIRDSAGWIWSDPNPGTGQKRDFVRGEHGNSVLSRIVGRTLGTARKAKVVIVVDDDKDSGGTILNTIDAFKKVYDDIKDNHKDDKVVVNISSGMDLEKYDKLAATVTGIIKSFHDDLKNVILVVAAGNGRPGTKIVDYPERLAETTNPDMVVVGGVNENFKNEFQTAPFVKVSVRGTNIPIAVGTIKTIKKHDEGTSLTTPTVAGLLACFMARGDDPAEARKRLYDNAYPRVDGGPPVAWNGVNYLDLPDAPDNTPDTPDNTPLSAKHCAAKQVTKRSISHDGEHKYVSRDAPEDIPNHYLDSGVAYELVDGFCRDAVAQGELDEGSGSISRKYNENTPDAAAFAIDWKPGTDFKPTMKECKERLEEILKTCDGNNPENPMDWKSGGSVDVEHKAGKSTYKVVSVWGNGTLRNETIEGLHRKVDECVGAVNTFKFDYGLDKDPREWTFSLDLSVAEPGCVGRSVEAVFGVKDVSCEGE